MRGSGRYHLFCWRLHRTPFAQLLKEQREKRNQVTALAKAAEAELAAEAAPAEKPFVIPKRQPTRQPEPEDGEHRDPALPRPTQVSLPTPHSCGTDQQTYIQLAMLSVEVCGCGPGTSLTHSPSQHKISLQPPHPAPTSVLLVCS